ncbi:MAG: transglutaminase-like domain-containing protein [Myxococcota bacterium]
MSAVVKSPKAISHPQSLQHLELTFTGFGEMTPPEASRQKVYKQGDVMRIVLSRDAAPDVKLEAAHLGEHEFLKATPFIQSDAPRLQEIAKEVVGDAEDVLTATSRISAYVYKHIRDEYVPAYSNALEALDSGRGDCTEHSILFVAMARAVGIPARVAVGIAYWPPGDGFGWHAWAEVQAGKSWFSVDPTWNQPIADVTHVKLADGGPEQQARIVMLLGRLKIIHVVL